MRVATLALAFAIVAASGASAHTVDQGGLQVIHPWITPATAGSVTEAHPTFVNKGEERVVITRATSPAARLTRLVRNGEPVKELALAPGQTLGPGQVVIRLYELVADLPEGKAVPMTLHIRNMAPMEVYMAVGQETRYPDDMVETPKHSGGYDHAP